VKGKVSFNKFSLLLVIILALTGCEKVIDKAVVKVDDEIIYLSLFKKRYKGYMENSYQSDNLLTRYSFLNKLVDEKLILKYARENNLGNDPSYTENVSSIYDQMLLNYYFDKKINKNFKITDSDTRKLFIWQSQKAHICHLSEV